MPSDFSDKGFENDCLIPFKNFIQQIHIHRERESQKNMMKK